MNKLREGKIWEIWSSLPEEQRTILIEQARKPIVLFGDVLEGFTGLRVIEIDPEKPTAPRVLPAFFGIDLSMESRKGYLIASGDTLELF